MEKIPADLQKALNANPKAKAKWSELTPLARRDFKSWIVSPKQAKTRALRIQKACSMLLAGKKRPCCYSIVPLRLYTMLNSTPKAKSTWKTLTPDEKRDFLDWIGEANEPALHEKRMEKTCALLAGGKRRP